EDDAPGGIIIGQAGASVPASWTETNGDEYYYGVGEFSIPVGESRSVVTFVNWDPQTLIEGDYDNSGNDPDLLNTSADNVVAAMADFAALDGVLANGIDDVSTVVNWDAEPVVEEEPEPELADTGAADATAFGLAALVLFGTGIVLMIRRRATA
ncbi:MAG: LPXTG cell wall anchor domain-containing protein, partial [Microcella sp.]|nr:LPXTG cell wall anchor domain-containing protein [Microcella sp.]